MIGRLTDWLASIPSCQPLVYFPTSRASAGSGRLYKNMYFRAALYTAPKVPVHQVPVGHMQPLDRVRVDVNQGMFQYDIEN